MQKSVIFLFILSFACNAANQPKPQPLPSPPGYHLEQPEKIRLAEKMDEISGIAYYPPLNSLVAVNDEMGSLFAIPINGKSPYPRWKFAKNGDFEDLVFTGLEWYALKSNGNLFRISNCFTDSIKSVSYSFPDSGRNEFEALYFDSVNNRVNLICKSCSNETSNLVKVYGFDINTQSFLPAPVYSFQINPEKIEKNFLRPSGAAIHPITKELYVIASINRLLLTADSQGHITEYYALNKKVFKQPEGICFTPNGDLYISNEAKGGTANILKFSFQERK